MEDHIEQFLKNIADYGDDVVAACQKEFEDNIAARQHPFKVLFEARGRLHKADDEVLLETARRPFVT